MADSLSHLSCPRCAAQLHLAHVSSVQLHGCGRCGGLWLDNASAARLLARSCPEIGSLADLASQNAQQHADVEGAIRCPACQQALKRVPGGDPTLLIDICEAHGTWFDRGELQQVAALAERQRERQRAAWSTAAGAGVGLAGAAAAVALGAQDASVPRPLEGAGAAAVDAASTVGAAAADVGSAALEAGAEVVVEFGVELVIEGICAVVGGILESL